MRADDAARLAAFDAKPTQALLSAFAHGSPDDVAILSDALRGAGWPAEQALATLPGDWTCQTIKLGGLLPIVVYAPFRCRIDEAGGFEKLSGSQRTRGHLSIRDGRVIYLGTGFVAGDTPPDYAALPDHVDPGAMPQFMPEIGIVQVTGPDAARVLLPLPHLESDLNLLVLRR
ncbi:DUF4893 domain-containing protein [Paracoccus stylophorae]|uniref:DUF4893 domain-containing protein n=1 Tax=Paracoccus stylophorae TaxID=659350 RepID=A0ABY7SR08_9RHOB|nr:DUF4893 domain-containing protein [Paracoccus stylophorae]WCR09464.1 DUF4893 domain-containing protein [Paracoccus stylophorae]